VRGARRIARVDAPSCQPGPLPILPPKRINGIPGPGSWLILAHLRAPAKQGEKGEHWRMPLVLLATLLVLALVVLLIVMFLAVRRWL
jgi:hypothetical protein